MTDYYKIKRRPPPTMEDDQQSIERMVSAYHQLTTVRAWKTAEEFADEFTEFVRTHPMRFGSYLHALVLDEDPSISPWVQSVIQVTYRVKYGPKKNPHLRKRV